MKRPPNNTLQRMGIRRLVCKAQPYQKRKNMGSVLDLAPHVTVTDPLSPTTTFGYDDKGNLTTITVEGRNGDILHFLAA